MALHARSARQQSTRIRLVGIARLAILLEIFLGLGALFGGAALILAPDGHLLGMPTKLLAAAITVRRHAFAPLAAVAVGLTLIGWVSVEMVVLAGPGSLAWAFYLVLGACIGAVGVAWWKSSPVSVDHPKL